MTLEEQQLRDEFCLWGGSLFRRGYTAGSSGNLSARLADGFLVTPTNFCLGYLEPGRLSKLNAKGMVLLGNAPTKEYPCTWHSMRQGRRQPASCTCTQPTPPRCPVSRIPIQMTPSRRLPPT